MPEEIRPARPEDAAACASVYRPYVTDTAITFETVPPDAGEMADRIRKLADSHGWLVAERDGHVIGYAYAAPFAAREAYRWSCESSVYLTPECRGAGLGRALYRDLLDVLVKRGFHVVVGKMTLPNPASVALHEAFGFRRVGIHERIGYKLGAWHDVAIAQLDLTPPATNPPEPS